MSEADAPATDFLGRPTLAPVPAFALRLVLGEMADSLLASTRVRPERLRATAHAAAGTPPQPPA